MLFRFPLPLLLDEATVKLGSVLRSRSISLFRPSRYFRSTMLCGCRRVEPRMALPPPPEDPPAGTLDEESVVDEGGAGECTMRGRPRRRLGGASGGVSVAERSAVDVGILCCWWWDAELLLPSWFCLVVDVDEGAFDADAFLPTPPGGVIVGVPGLPFTRTLGLAPGLLA
jgi:hypothetical protein